MLFVGAGLASPYLVALGLPDVSFEGVTVGLLVAFMDYLDRLFRPLRELSGKVTILQRAVASLSKIFWLFEAGEKAPTDGAEVDRVSGHLVLEDVWYRYGDDAEDVLRGVNLEVKAGESLALVGASGSGKTTLTRLLDRSYSGYRGSIRMDGIELSALSLRSLRRRLATVRQDVQVFNDTVRFNVDLGNPAISDAQAEEAATLVNADRFLNRLGWDHLLRERGADLSVGESQLLTFARTMAHNPDLVILDEATASVDSLTEGLVQDAIQRILERKTVIVIAHRLSTVQKADRIAVMQRGKVVEQGSHAQLMARDGPYAALVRAGQGVVADSPDEP
jgi:ATP-binding cassette, subfamily B, multidrug efflux pump